MRSRQYLPGQLPSQFKYHLKLWRKYSPGIDQKPKQCGIIEMECLPALIGVVYGHITFKSTRKLAE